MSYAISISPEVERQIVARPEPLRGFIRASLQKLGQSPARFIRPSRSLTRGQVAEFKYDQAGAVLWVTVRFMYGQDEQTLHIERIAVEFGG
jgi:hypothetical protein